MKNLLLGASFTLLSAMTAFAASQPQGGLNDSRIKTVAYQADQVYTFHGHYGYGTTIKFNEFEKIESISLGASNSWQIVPNNERNLIFIKPVEEDASTNMTIITNERFYHFELSAHTAKNARAKDIIYELQFIYPNETAAEYSYGGLLAGGPETTNIVSYNSLPVETVVESAVTSAASEVSKVPEDTTLTVELFDKPRGQEKPNPRGPNANTNYTMKGDPELAPSIIYDDGEFTYIKFADSTDIPSIFSVDKNQEESILNVFNRDGYIVIDHVGSQFTFRNGEIATCIYNKNYNGDAPVFQGGLNNG